ncbi:MAG: sufD, partial [Chlamydiia bacterium]|nr:sufD [Chlamydiia bacterium]
MMTIDRTEFLSSFAAVQQSEPEVFKKLRQRAWERFLEIGPPHEHTDKYAYMRLKPLYQESFLKAEVTSCSQESIVDAVLPECKNSYIVFVDGLFTVTLSDVTGIQSSIVLLPLSAAMKSYGTLLQNSWTKALKEENDPFALLNMACCQDGAFLYIPPKLEVTQPIQVIHVSTEQQRAVWLMPRLHLFQGKHSKVVLTTTTFSKNSQKCLLNALTEITVEEGASLICTQQSEMSAGWQFEALRMNLKRSANCKIFQIGNGDAVVRRDSKIELAGEAAEVSISGAWLLDKSKEIHVNILIEHQEPHTHSMQLFKGVLTDSAQSNFQGRIFVHKKAQKTEAYQLNNNLVLSDKSHANSKPDLEIFADDVKASHGTTVGQLEPEELFYLKARGFSEQDARSCLIAGFCREVLSELPIASQRAAA